MQKKTLFFAGILVCLVVAGWGYYQYQKPRADAADAVTAYRITAEQLYNDYSADEGAAGKKYNGTVIEVSGVIADVQTTAHATNVLLRAGTTPGGVNCGLQKGEQNITIGQPVTIKGRCTGFLMDVSLVDAIITK